MDPITAILILMGCAAFLAGCAQQETEDDIVRPVNVEPIPKENVKCMPVIENQQWQCTDEKHTANTCDTVTCDSFMFCLHGYGIIYIYKDGQQEGEMKVFGAFRVMELWLEEGYGTISAERLDQALEDARNYGGQKSIKNFGDDEEKYTKFDTSILAWTNFWNARQTDMFGAGNFTPVRAEIIKCIINRESSMGTGDKKNAKNDGLIVTSNYFAAEGSVTMCHAVFLRP